LPFTLLYSLGIRLRNYLFDIEYTRTISFEPFIISVGNLVAGGAGKTPMVEYLVGLLKDLDGTVSVLSRGYKRKTSGIRIAGNEDTAKTIGDEPYQIWRKYGNRITVAVGEERVLAIPTILQEVEDTKVIILDDAYQHRYVVRDLDILLTTYSNPFFKDYLLPSGRLREPRKESKRADIIVVTKCPNGLSSVQMQNFKKTIQRYTRHNKEVFFTQVKYLKPRNGRSEELQKGRKIVGFAGLAKSNEFRSYLAQNYDLITFRSFPDHHMFKEHELNSIQSQSDRENATLVTSEKDWVRLPEELQDVVYYIPIETCFVEGGKRFDSLILDAVASKINP